MPFKGLKLQGIDPFFQSDVLKAGRIHTSKNPGSRNSGTPLCTGEIHASDIRFGLGRTHGFPDSHCASRAYGQNLDFRGFDSNRWNSQVHREVPRDSDSEILTLRIYRRVPRRQPRIKAAQLGSVASGRVRCEQKEGAPQLDRQNSPRRNLRAWKKQ